MGGTCVTYFGNENAYKILAGKREMILLVILAYSWEDNIKIDIK
jgi:hypothetical protein